MKIPIENVLFAIVITLSAIILFIIYGIIHQYENYGDANYADLYRDLAAINPINYKSGDLIIVRTVGKYAHCIRTTINREYNHAGILFFSNSNGDMKSGNTPHIFHATTSGVQLRNLEDYIMSGRVEWFKVARISLIKSHHRHMVKQFINDHNYAEYEYPLWTLLNETINFVTHPFGHVYNIHHVYAYNCVRLVNKFYKEFINLPISISEFNVDAFIMSPNVVTSKRINVPIHSGETFLNTWRS